MTLSQYRIPFYATVEGTVKTASGVGVPDVLVSLCRINPDTNANDANEDYCPLRTFTTDRRGVFSGEIRVSDVLWNNSIEYFNVTAFKQDSLKDGTIITHVFEPSSQVLSVTHLREGISVSIVDNTSVTIYGKTAFDPNFIDGYNCGFGDVPVIMIDEDGEETYTTTNADGSFNFTITRGTEVEVYIPDYGGHSWRSEIVTTDNHVQRRLQTTTIAPTRSPTRAPTLAPTRAPTLAPSFPPTRPPTLAPSTPPTFNPSAIPTRPPTLFPTVQPTAIIIAGETAAQLLQRFEFDSEATADAGYKYTIDSIYRGEGRLYGGVTVAKGVATFSGAASSYIQLPRRSLNPATGIVTVEAWISFGTISDNTILFSFGSPDNDMSCAFSVGSAYSNRKNVHLVVLCNAAIGYATAYENGVVKVASVAIPSTVGAASTNHDYIGHNGRGTSPAFMGEIQEFRIYYGALGADMVYSNFLSGADQSRLTFASDITKSNINVTFYATSRQTIRVNMYGGLNPIGSVSKMFDSSSQFLLKPVDATCGYSKGLSLSSTSSFVGVFAAMNYTVTLTSAVNKAPSFSSSACDPNSGAANCICAQSLLPLTYFQSTNTASQDITIVTVNSSEYTVNYNYRSGMCMSVSSTDTFSTTPGSSSCWSVML